MADRGEYRQAAGLAPHEISTSPARQLMEEEHRRAALYRAGMVQAMQRGTCPDDIGGRRKEEGEVMKGHLKERSPGHWAIILDVRDPQTGARRRKWHSFAGTSAARRPTAHASSPKWRMQRASKPTERH
jgi:hypothetical protein